MVSRLIQVVALDRFDLHVRGMEKLPQSGPYIISSNHESYIDPLILASVLPPPIFNKVFAVGTSEIFVKDSCCGWRARSESWSWTRANLIPRCVRARSDCARALAHSLSEGERSIDGTPKTFKKGAAILSIHLQCRLCR